MQVLELTQGERVEIEILTVLVQCVQQGRQHDGTDGTNRPGRLCTACKKYTTSNAANLVRSVKKQLYTLMHIRLCHAHIILSLSGTALNSMDTSYVSDNMYNQVM